MGLVLLLGLLGSAPARSLSSTCEDVYIRLWEKSGETWYDAGQPISIAVGGEGHVYIHTRARGDNKYTAQATFGYPSTRGHGTEPKATNRSLSLRQQNGDDRANGRLRFQAEHPGTTEVSFHMTGVKPPGRLDDVRSDCRQGTLTIQVVDESRNPGRDGPDLDRREQDHGGSHHGDNGHELDDPALDVVTLLYSSFLRRDDVGSLEASFVDTVRRDRQDGIAWVVDQITTSDEFRRSALQRTEEAHGTAPNDELRHQLQQDIYRDLYGYVSPCRDEESLDARNLEVCLSTDRLRRDACRSFGRDVVSRRAFFDRNRDLLMRLGSPTGHDG